MELVKITVRSEDRRRLKVLAATINTPMVDVFTVAVDLLEERQMQVKHSLAVARSEQTLTVDK